MDVARVNIEIERARLQLTKEQIAKQLHITSKTYLSYIHCGAMPVKKAIELSRMFDCSLDYLLGLSEQRKRVS